MGSQKWILVTGGAGFIGSHHCLALLNAGHSVCCVDNLSSGSEANLKRLSEYQGFRFIEHDVVHPLVLEASLAAVYHLACPASPRAYQENPVQTFKTAVLGSLNMLELAREQGARILLSSTSEVYGDPEAHPQAEGYWGHVNPIGIRSCYDEGKRGAESLFMDYHRQYGVDTKIARIFNTYGPGMAVKDGRVVPNFIVQALAGEDITIYGSGDQTRSFQYVDDCVRGLMSLMGSGSAVRTPVNIGNPTEVSIGSLAERIVMLTPSRSAIVYQPLPKDDPRRRRPCIALARELLGWSPEVNLDEGLLKTISYFRTRGV